MTPEVIAYALGPWWPVTLAAATALAAWPLSLVGLNLVRGAE